MKLTQRPKFEFLDGMRGLSALYVALYHAQLFTGYGFKVSDLTPIFKPFSIFLNFGHFSVAVFIVLSGFCLSIPVAISTDGKLKGGFTNYIKRRARRIIPPYYFALGIFIILIKVVPVLNTFHNTAWDSKIPVTWQSILSHIFLVHNLNQDWLLKIDGPMWSVATEWQIYFFFPVLLFIWRKINTITAVITAYVISILPYLFMPANNNLSWLHPWYLGLFALGMASAILVFSVDERIVKFRERINWNKIVYPFIFLMIVCILLTYFKNIQPIISETFIGFVICLIIIKYTLKEINGEKRTRMLKFLNTKFAVDLGVFSYSIYLIHSPLLGLFNLLTLNFAVSINIRLLCMLLVFVPISICISYIFHYYIERRYMSGHLGQKAKELSETKL